MKEISMAQGLIHKGSYFLWKIKIIEWTTHEHQATSVMLDSFRIWRSNWKYVQNCWNLKFAHAGIQSCESTTFLSDRFLDPKVSRTYWRKESFTREHTFLAKFSIHGNLFNWSPTFKIFHKSRHFFLVNVIHRISRGGWTAVHPPLDIFSIIFMIKASMKMKLWEPSDKT